MSEYGSEPRNSSGLLAAAIITVPGVLAAAGAYFAMIEAADPEGHNRAVAACADKLGPVATHNATLPEECGSFESALAAGGKTVRIEPSGTRIVTYDILPRGDAFVAEQRITPEQQAARKQFAGFLGILAGGVGLLGGGVANEVRKAYGRQSLVHEPANYYNGRVAE